MPDASSVGVLALPIADSAVGATLADPTAYYLLHLAGLAIKEALDTRLLRFRPENSITDACPVANRFNFDPTEPRGFSVKLPKPSLFVWWEGKSTTTQHTALRFIRKRPLNLLYVFEELASMNSMTERHGLMNVVDSALFRMSQRQINYSYNDGKTLSEVHGKRDNVCWEYSGGQPGRFGIDEGPGAARRAAKKSGRDWPALFATFMVEELVEPAQPGDDDTSEANLETLFNMDANAGEGESFDYFSRYLEGWEGCDD